MSRIGKKAIDLPAGVTVSVTDRVINVEKGKAKLSFTHKPAVTVEVDTDGKQIKVGRVDDTRMSKALHGTTRMLIANMIEGVTKGFEKALEINGVGWGAQLKGKTISLNVGYAFPRVVEIPDGVEVIIQGNRIVVKGADKQSVGQFCADVRRQRKPEPYNGKGIKYTDEVIQRKQGKQFAG